MKRPFEPPQMTNPSRALPPLPTKSMSHLSFLYLGGPPRCFFLFIQCVCTQCVWLSRTPSAYTDHVSPEEKTLPTDSAGLVGEVWSGWHLHPLAELPVCLLVHARKQTLGLSGSFFSTPSMGSSPDGCTGRTQSNEERFHLS